MRGIPGGDVDPEANFWIFVFLILSLGVGYLLNKLTNGFLFRYRKANVNEYILKTLYFVHLVGSTITAFILPNNYLYKLPFFKLLYKYNPIGVGISIMVILFVLIIIIGIIFTLLLKKRTQK